jgi:hypothetical protein
MNLRVIICATFLTVAAFLNEDHVRCFIVAYLAITSSVHSRYTSERGYCTLGQYARDCDGR